MSDNHNAGKPWSKEEDTQLLKLYQEDQLDILEISKIHKRNINGILARLIRNKVIPNKTAARGYTNTSINMGETTVVEPELIKIKEEEYFLFGNKIYTISKTKGKLYGLYDKDTNTIIASQKTLNDIINWIDNNHSKNLRITWKGSISNEIIRDHFKDNINFVKSGPNVVIYYNYLMSENWSDMIDEAISMLSSDGTVLIHENKSNTNIDQIKAYMVARGFSLEIKESLKSVFIIASKVFIKPKRVMFLDTETSGIPYSNDYTQLNKFDNARLLELGYIIYDEETMVLEFESIVKPENFIVTNDFVHGITNDNAIKNGKPLKYVLERLYTDLQQVDAIICHNIRFDMSILLSECYRINYTDLLKLIESKAKLCTMKLGKEFMSISKSPKLVELYKFIFNEEVKQDHRSLSDCYICAKCYFMIIKNNI